MRTLWTNEYLPFQPALHGKEYFEATLPAPEIYDFLPFGPYTSSEAFIDEVIYPRVQKDPGIILFAILDKTKPRPPPEKNREGAKPEKLEVTEGSFAGVIGLLNTKPNNLATEIGFVIIFPEFQRTHVTTNATGLLLQWCLNLPKEGGLGLRRVQWQTNNLNDASKRAAERVGFQLESVERWQRVLPEGKVGTGSEGVIDKDGRKDWPGRHTAILSLCWDDWAERKDGLQREMDRIA